jgi:predicted DCC family thiol-disulfide oxidoreductase YuxK
MHVIIFDGYCNLCNGVVDFLIKRDKKRHFIYVANQSKAGRYLLSSLGENPEEVETFFFLKDGVLHKRSTAALHVMQALGFPWNLGLIGWLLPRQLRDGIYKWVARNRYRWFGKKDSCRMPTEEERALLIEQKDALPLSIREMNPML